ncbi:hypothetical protein [Ramlibacter albus]|uniref:Uncharacterized protein n=1 Tax=Ramlibacter albus TaxID=2079448 RepID=A0A923M5N0_9BURK|nr:hypothetical protein [Ramlibacter albus]MBC5763363.1 hypothetical protein [Ramlibacter albus]
MNRQQQIDEFLVQAHRLAVVRLREHPERLGDVAALMDRWRQLNGSTRADVYRDEWDELIAEGVDAIERVVCADTEHAAVLRSVSPISVLITQQERGEMLRRVRQAR